MPIDLSGRLRAAGHDETLSLVAHLDELRTRIIVSLLAVGIAFGLCFWQNGRLLSLIDRPLARQTQAQVRAGEGPLGATYTVQRTARDVAIQLEAVVAALAASSPRPVAPSALARVSRSLRADARSLSAPPGGDRPVTLGIGEPFTTTVTVSLVLALILSAPVLLLQAWAFLAPALEPDMRRRVRPLLPAVPTLFAAGVAFGYVAVLPAAVRFLQNFNSSQFNVLVQAAPYYRFAATTLLAMGLVFELPVAILAVTRAGLVSIDRLRRSRRWALAICAAIATMLPGDAVTMLLEAAPLYVLFELSLVIATVADRRSTRSRDTATASATGP